ncbi:MAG: protein kinase domain-containing protein [Bradymonadia bacterium]
MGQTPSDPLIGQTLDGEFEVISRIGEGGFGSVYKAIQHPLGRKVAVKVLKTDGPMQNPVVQSRFFREAKAIANLRSPHTVTLLKYNRTTATLNGITQPIVYMALEFIDGPDLRTLVEEKGPLPPNRVRDLALDILESLQEAHDQGIIHRDLKPENVLVDTSPDGREYAKVLDFGIAKAMEEGEALDESLTREGTMLGTPVYMAPEQFTRDPIGPYTDVYSLGMMLYALLTGSPPYHGSTYSVMYAHTQAPPPPLPEQLEGLPLGAVLQKAMAKTPSSRYANAGQMRAALLNFDENSEGLSPTIEAPRPLTPPPILSRQLTPPTLSEVDSTPLPMVGALGPIISQTPGPDVEPTRSPEAASLPVLDTVHEPVLEITEDDEDLIMEGATDLGLPPFSPPTAQIPVSPAPEAPSVEGPHIPLKIQPPQQPMVASRPGPPSSHRPPSARRTKKAPSVMLMTLVALLISTGVVFAVMYATGQFEEEVIVEQPELPGGSVNLGGVTMGCPKGMVAITPDDVGKLFCIDTHERPGADNTPEQGVSLKSARAQCAAAGRRLCTGKEWVRACGAGRHFPYGNTFEAERCATDGELAASGSFERCAGRFGTYDMSGNVAEWTADGKIRGGDVSSGADQARCDAQVSAKEAKGMQVGFRCCARHRQPR